MFYWYRGALLDMTGTHNVMVRQFCEADLSRLPADVAPLGRTHHRERFEAQQCGSATYLGAWCGDVLCGRVLVLHRSNYPRVRAVLGVSCELNALRATPTGTGVGSQLLFEAERYASNMGASRIGGAVACDNLGTHRFYGRFGYVEWGHGLVTDRWVERNVSGEVVRVHTTRGIYLVKELSPSKS